MDQPERRRAQGLLLAAQHQLRQPLNALSLMIGELRQGPGGRDLAGIADDMRHAVRLSNAWLDALVDLEAAEQGAVELDLQAVPLQPVFGRLEREFAPRLAEFGLSFRVVATRATVRADAAHLYRLLALLLDNAVKFTRSGAVLLGCRNAGGGRLRIEVRDSGAGVSPGQAARLFEPFFRLENEVRPRERGLGLGLAYARCLAELAGDRLTVESRPGRGSCFAVTLRRAGAAATAEDLREAGTPDHASAIINPLAGVEVLILEGTDAASLGANLESWGAVARPVAAGGLAAALAAVPPLLIADGADFAAAGGWHQGPADGTALVLVGGVPPPAVRGQSTAGAVHALQRPVKPARLRALCHFALTKRR